MPESEQIERKSCVLVVDDEPMVGTVLAEFLKRWGFDVELVETGEEAVCLLDDCRVDLVLLDFLLPGWSGMETLEEIRSRHPCLPVMLMSGLEEDGGLRDDARARGAIGMISKSAPFSEMLTRIQDALQAGHEPEPTEATLG